MLRSLALLVVASALGVACVETRTQLLVFVHTDFPPGSLDGFAVRVVGDDDEVHDRGTFSLAGPTAVALPASFGVAPRGGDAARHVLIEVDAVEEGAALFTTRARTSFVDGQIMRLDLFLARRCRHDAQDCPEDQTCGPRGCVPIDVPVEELLPSDGEPALPRPAADWTIWSDGGSSGWVDTDETGAAFVGLNVARGGALEIEGVAVPLGPAATAVIARVEPDGSSPWKVELRSPGAGFVVVQGVVVGEDVVWVVGNGIDGVVLEREGEILFEHPDPTPLFAVQMSPAGDFEAAAVASGEGAIVVTGLTLDAGGDLALGGAWQQPGVLLDQSWAGSPGGQGVLLRIARNLDSAEPCAWPESPSYLWGVASIGGVIATAGGDGARPVARGIAPGCGTSWDASQGVVGSYLSIASSPGRPLVVLSDIAADGPALSTFEPASGAWSPGVRLVIEGNWAALHTDADSTGRVLAYGSAQGHIEYGGLVTELPPGLTSCFLLGASADLAGRWLERLESDGGCLMSGTALDPVTGAAIFAATTGGTVRWGPEVLGVREGRALVVHRFVP